MPTYSYMCTKCFNLFDTHSSIAKRNEQKECPKCHYLSKRNVAAELNIGPKCKWVTEKERWSVSMGVPQSQVAEFRKRFPDSVYDNNGRLLIKDRKDKLRQMKERDMVELDSNHIGKR